LYRCGVTSHESPSALSPSTSLESKTTVVVGGAHGHGHAIVCELVDRGARVAIVDGGPTAGAAADVPVLTVRADASHKPTLVRARETIEGSLGAIDLLVTISASGRTPVLDITERVWEDVLKRTLIVPFHAVQVFCPAMVERGGGSVVNVTPEPSASADAYTVAKEALLSLTRAVAYELGPSGIRANCVSPGIGAIHASREVARVVAFLLSEASGYVTGQEIHCDGSMLSSHEHGLRT